MHLYRNGALGKTDSIEKIDAGAGPEQGWGVGIWCGNRPGASDFLLAPCHNRVPQTERPSIMDAEWQMIDMATQAFGLVSCALYDTLGPNTTGAFLCLCFLGLDADAEHFPLIHSLRLQPRPAAHHLPLAPPPAVNAQDPPCLSNGQSPRLHGLPPAVLFRRDARSRLGRIAERQTL